MTLASESMKKKTIYYDGSCEMCNNLLKRVNSSDQKDKFDPKDLTKAPLPNSLKREDLEKEIHVVDEKGRVYKNAEAILKILEEYPKWNFLATIARLPIVKQILPFGYKIIAKHRHNIFGPASGNCVDKFIVFIFVYILIVFPLALFTNDDFFPFSRYPMFHSPSLNPFGYQIHLYKNDQPVKFQKVKVSNLLYKYLLYHDKLLNQGSSNAKMCQMIREYFWPKNLSNDSFYVKRYSTSIRDLPSLQFDEGGVLLSCR